MRLKVLVLAVAVAAPANAKVTVTTSRVGPFTIAAKIDDISDTPIMHAPLVTKEVRLGWQSEDGRARFGLIDNGSDLTASYGIAKLVEGELVCGTLSGGKLLQYQNGIDSHKQWVALEKDWLLGLATNCRSLISVEQLSSYKKQFEASAAEFPAAIETMKVVAREQFGGWRRRCLNYKHIKGTWAGFRCVRQSAKEN